MGVQDAIRNHPALGGLVTGAVLGAGGAAIVNVVRSKRRKKTSSSIVKSRRKTTKKSKKTKTRKKTTSGRKKSKKGSKKIFKTKNGQPYILKPNGQAKFISKKSARIRRKRKGGYS